MTAAPRLGDDHLSPDCRDGKHSACRGEAWCTVTDDVQACECSCHSPAVAS